MTLPHTPSRIYLQVGDDAESLNHYSESTWCADRINESDVEYVRGDLASTWPAALTGWKVERKQDIMGTIIVKAPNGFSAVVSKIDRNQANVLYMLANALFEGAAPTPAEPAHQDTAPAGDLVEAVTKAIMFEDCGSAEDWQENTNLGVAAIKAMSRDLNAEEWSELYRLREEVKGPDGYATWQDAALAERVGRVKAERALSAAPAQPAPGGEDRRDSERLDWIESMIQQKVAVRLSGWDGSLQFVQLRHPGDIIGNYPVKLGLRAAIDAAMSATSPPPTSRPFTPEEHAAWERENGVGEAAKGEGERHE